MGGATKLFRKYGNLQVPRTWRNWHAEPTFAPPKVAVLTVVQVSDAWSAHRTFWLSDQLSVRKQAVAPRVVLAPDLDPPPADRSDGEGRCLMRRADDDIFRIPAHIVDAIRDAMPGRPTGEVMVQHRPAVPPPAPSRVLEVPHQLLLLRVHADDGQPSGQIPPPQARQVTELPIPIRVPRL